MIYINISRMNIFDELGGLSPKTEGGFSQQPKEKQKDEF